MRSQSRARTARAVTVACFGEILWDCLPRGIFLGGAPCNAAYHLSRQGVRAFPVSALGRDFLGEEAHRRLAGWGLDCRWIFRHRTLPTGVVRAALDRKGVASYQIIRHVAWDRIEVPTRAATLPPRAVVFGTLALRETPNRRTLARLFAAWPRALRVADINLRPPFTSAAVLAFVLRHAQMVKLNDLELAQLTGAAGKNSRALEHGARDLACVHDLQGVCVTAGARGAGLLWDGRWHWEPAHPVEVRDTVGAGDAFLGGLLGALLQHRQPPARALRRACRVAEFVTARDGATPAYQIALDGKPRDEPR